MGEFKDHSSKKIIREQWCKPLIKFIHEALGYKLMYLGLPGPQALDLLNWIEYIDHVVAFQCRDYPKPSSTQQSRNKVLELEKKLTEFERQKKLTTFVVYDGFMEEVILRGRDTNGNCFSQNEVVTVYNLDFCNGITVPLTITDDRGNTKEVYKSEVIRKLLEIQRDFSSQTRSKKFVIFLTIHSNFWYQEKKRFVDQMQDTGLKKYINSLNSLGERWPKNVKLLKAYLHQIIKNFFCHCDFTPEFLPVIYYKGIGKDRENWLMHFTIMGILNKQINANAPYLQNTNNFLNQKFLSVKNNSIDFLSIKGSVETNCLQNSIKAFEDSECYKQLWVKKKK